MEGEEFHIYLTDDARSFCVSTPRSISYTYHDKLKTELDVLKSHNIITPVTKATDWCTPIVVAPKKNSDQICMCVDLSHLNQYVKRERYQSPTPAEAIADISACHGKYISLFWMQWRTISNALLIQKTSSLLLSYTIWQMRAPYGISSISDNMPQMFENFCKDVLTRWSPWT